MNNYLTRIPSKDSAHGGKAIYAVVYGAKGNSRTIHLDKDLTAPALDTEFWGWDKSGVYYRVIRVTGVAKGFVAR